MRVPNIRSFFFLSWLSKLRLCCPLNDTSLQDDDNFPRLIDIWRNYLLSQIKSDANYLVVKSN